MQFGQLRRREFITLAGGATAMWPLAASAQQPVMPVGTQSPNTSVHLVAAFRRSLLTPWVWQIDVKY